MPPAPPSDPIRLAASPDATEAERALLHTWGDEHPSPALLQRTLAVLGLGGAVGIVAAGSSIAPKALAGWVVVAKWLGLAIMTASAVAAVTYVLSPSRTVGVKSAFVSPLVENVVAPKNVVAEPVLTHPVELPTKATPPNEKMATQSPAPFMPLRSVGSQATLTQQVAAVDRARSALDSGDAARARHLVDVYEAEYPTGAFLQEAEVVRIDALVREGNHTEADRVGKRFLAAYPNSPHAVRVEARLRADTQ